MRKGSIGLFGLDGLGKGLSRWVGGGRDGKWTKRTEDGEDRGRGGNRKEKINPLLFIPVIPNHPGDGPRITPVNEFHVPRFTLPRTLQDARRSKSWI